MPLLQTPKRAVSNSAYGHNGPFSAAHGFSIRYADDGGGFPLLHRESPAFERTLSVSDLSNLAPATRARLTIRFLEVPQVQVPQLWLA
jgi:hypothetical protein